MWRAAKVCFLYIGTVIGAGFASGKEIALFFGDTAPAGVALAAFFMALPEALFLYAGKHDLMPSGTVVRTGVFIAALSSVAAMLAGCELALDDLTGVAGLGALAAVAAGVLVVLGTEKMKLANALLIPLLLLLLVAVYVKGGAPAFGGTFSLLKPVHYAGLDVLIGGMIISKEGKKLSAKEIFFTCAMSALFLGGVLFMLQNIVLSDETHSSMPVLAVAESVGLKAAAGVLVVIAVFTTLVSSLSILTDESVSALRAAASPSRRRGLFRRAAAFLSSPSHRAAAVFCCLAALYPVSFFGFENIVAALYPFVGACGVVMTAVTAFKVLRCAFSRGGDRTRSRHRRDDDRTRSRHRRDDDRTRTRPHPRPRRCMRAHRCGKIPRRGNGGCHPARSAL